MSRKVEDEAWARQQIADVPALCVVMAGILLVNLITGLVFPDFMPICFVVVGLLIFGGLDELAKTNRARLILDKSEDAA
jgi:hypothetical protein